MTIDLRSMNSLLTCFGLAISSENNVTITNCAVAERCNPHHTFKPVAVMGWSAVSPAFAKGRLPKYQLADIITKRSNMDERTATTFAAVCGASVKGPFYNHAKEFDACLRSFLNRYRLADYFQECSGDYHYAIRPSGVNFDGSEEDIPADLKRWRRSYRQESILRRMLVASVLWLYRGEGDTKNVWLQGLPCRWHAADAYEELRAAGCLADWAELVARYPGW